ncbi:MAG: peptidase rane zinc metallopeptidase [Clostridia bacterium]|jgi:Zn-dependent membrane protease YugP|nr:peptidase rane zinc metallopeptidase [Clostridia bacterium]
MGYLLYGGYDGIFLLIGIVVVAISLYSSMKVQNTFNKYAKLRTLSGYSGEEAARRILMMNNINIPIKPIRGSMTDFYDPIKKELALSQTVYGANSISALGVAAHEVGHAIQDANDYAFLRLRHKIYPVTSFASRLSMPLVVLGFISTIPVFLQIGIIFFAFTTLFALVTLPVEFDASKRALASLETSGILGPQELEGAKKVLNAAALTYVAAAMVSVLSLLRLILMSNRRND